MNRGLYNFDEVRYDYFRDRSLELESLFNGTIDFREEFTSKDWATGYDGKPMVRDGRVLRVTIPDERPSGAQGFFINTRREKFKDPRVRQALRPHLRLRVEQPQSVLRALHAHRPASSTTPT